jgi:integrase
MSTYLDSLEPINNLNTLVTTSFTITTLKNSKKGKLEVTLSLSVNKSSVLMHAFYLVEVDFKANQVSYDIAYRTKNTFKLLQDCSDALNILSKPAHDINSYQLKSAIFHFESYLIDACASNVSRAIYSSFIRRYLANTNLTLQDGRTIKEELKGFKSRYLQSKKLFKLGNVLGNISNIKHTDIESLESQAKENISSSLDVIERTCKIIIDDYLKVTEDHRKLKEHCLSPETTRYYTDRLSLSDPWSKKYFKQPQEGTEQTLLTFILKSISYENISSTTIVPRLSQLPILLDGKRIWKSSTSYYSFFYAEYFLPNHVLIAIAVLICLKTGWNPGSVHALSDGDIEKLSATRYSLQSLKNKTDDKTPVYELRKALEPLLFKAIELLLWHHKQVTDIFKLSEPRFFIGIVHTKFAVFFPLAKQNLLTNFIIPYGLTDFSATDLRASRAGLTMLATKDIQVVRELLGHRSLSTTEGYLDSTLFFQLNEARILEFQRRIEATISFIDGGEALVSLRKFNKCHIDNKLFALEPIGDGTRCRNPYDSPDPNIQKGDRCKGMYCHVNGHCENNVIQVAAIDVMLAKRTQIYYRSRWSYLYENNPKAFTQIHIPKIIFIHVFLTHIKQVRPDLIKSIYV